MIKHIIKTAFRFLVNEKMSSLVNIAGLSATLIAVFIISIYINYEYSYDKFHKDSNRIFRVTIKSIYADGKEEESGSAISNVCQEIISRVKGIEAGTRIWPAYGMSLIQREDKFFSEAAVAYIDPDFFKVFSFPLLEGDYTKLAYPNTIIITKQTAQKYFDNAPSLNKNILINGTLYRVIGIMKDFPLNSHFRYNILISMATVDKNDDLFWEGGSFYTYIKVDKNSDIVALQDQINQLNRDLYSIYDGKKENDQRAVKSFLQPLTRIHLHSHFAWELSENGNINYIKTCILLAIFSILISTINFVNIFTAFSEKRVKLIFLNKVVGASRLSISKQLFAEIILTVLISLTIAILFVACLKDKYLNTLMGVELPKNMIFSSENIILFLSIAVFISLLSGIYPSLYLSRLSPVIGISGVNSTGMSRKSLIYKILICLQFVISLFFIISYSEIKNQVNFMKTKDLGFNKDNVLVYTNIPEQAQARLTTIRDELKANPFINSVTLSREIPGSNMPESEFKLKGTESNNIKCNFLRVDFKYINTFEMILLNGRNFDETRGNEKNCVIINESAAKALDYNSLLGKQIILDDQEFTIIGTIKDFHLQSLHNLVKPAILRIGASRDLKLIINTGKNFTQSTFNNIKEIIARNAPNYIPDYYFMKDRFDSMYKSEERIQSILLNLICIGVVISFTGIWAFSSLFIRKRIKEIGIRKIFGASNAGIINLLIRDFTPWIVVSFMLSIPAAYFFSARFVNNFAYNYGFSIYSSVYAIVCMISLIMLSIFYHYLLIAKSNPVSILKYE